ncbi:iron-siderophore ABC transporter substrate-binding protein [Paenibacillus sp. P26]|nr:iron-siderophore ABC transporter substrate-binding protein [Paenibacillus sp. P26]
MSFISSKVWYRGRTAGITAIILLLSVLLAACGSSTKGQEGSSGGSSSAQPANAESTRKVKHAMGETDVPAKPQRVVVLTNEGTEASLSLGIKPIAAVKSFGGDPWFDHIKADMQGVQVVGDENQPNIELIASLKPDLIIGNKLRQEKIYEQLKALAPTVFSETLLGEWKNNYRLYAEAVGKKDVGDQALAAFDKRIEDFRQKAGDKVKQTVSVVRFMSGKTRIYYENTFSGIIFKQIGIARPAKTSKETFADEITKERLPEADADILFYFTYDSGDGKASKQEQEWTQDPLWNNLKVVKNQKVYKVNDAVWNTAGGIKAANLMLDDLYKFYGISKS